MEEEWLHMQTNYSYSNYDAYLRTHHLEKVPTSSDIALAVFTFILLVAELLSNGTLTYVVFRHGYGSTVGDTLVLNWAFFSSVYGIAYSGFMNAHQYYLRKAWKFGDSACVIASYLEYYCVLPVSILPVTICVHLYLRAFPSADKWRMRFAQIPSSVWVSLGLWATMAYCMLGAFFQGSNTFVGYIRDMQYCHMVTDGNNYHILNGYYAFQLLATFLVPTPAMFMVSVLTVVRLRKSANQTLSTLANKILVERLIFLLTGIFFICHFGGQVSLWLRNVHIEEQHRQFIMFMPTPYTAGITFALLGCHVEFWRGIFCRQHHIIVADETSIITDGNSSEAGETSLHTNMTNV